MEIFHIYVTLPEGRWMHIEKKLKGWFEQKYGNPLVMSIGKHVYNLMPHLFADFPLGRVNHGSKLVIFHRYD